MFRHSTRLVGAFVIAASLFVAVPSAAQEEDFTVYSASSSLAEDHANVFRLYWAFFDRSPDGGGARYWAGQYDQCASLLDITWSFSTSDEFTLLYGRLSHEQYIDLVYANVLDRAADAGGKTYWLQLLDSGELIPSEVMLYFSLSDEFKAQHPLPSDGRVYGGCNPPSEQGVYYANCAEARNAGAAPLLRDDPGYRSGLDRDDDGIACEI